MPLDRIGGILETLQSFKEEGLTKMLGVGGNPSVDFMPYINQTNFQVLSGFCRLDACTLTAFDNELPHLIENDIAYYAASSLHFSLLGNRFETYTKTPPQDTEYIGQKEIQNAIKVNEIAKKYGIPLPTLAQRYLFSINEATRVVMGGGLKKIAGVIVLLLLLCMRRPLVFSTNGSVAVPADCMVGKISKFPLLLLVVA